MDVNHYLSMLPAGRQEKVLAVVTYLRKQYPHFLESCDYGPKTKFPVFTHPNHTNYVGIASQKAYIALHFGRYECPSMIAAVNPRIKTGVGCAKIPDTVPFPLEEIRQAIDTCFEER